ncbi:MAG: FAD:protein FMN transferase [Bacteroidales bacterium]|nr:FAD:protein FMN transferase [Bacteroidales bacterium]
MKKSYYVTLMLVVAVVIFGISRYRSQTEASAPAASPYTQLSGEVFHTFYHITYQGTVSYRHEIDSLLHDVDASLSMFNPASTLSRMNSNDPSAVADPYFRTVFEKGQSVSARTDGFFDMTVAPLVNLWGFGFRNSDKVTPRAVDSCLQFVGYQTVRLDADGHLHKQHPQTILDASSIAKGFACDVVASFLQSRHIEDYLVEIGGEVALSGVNAKGQPWTIGIARPVPDSLQADHGYQAYLTHLEGGLATSGNYRNFYEKDGKRIAHTINPKTGYPIQKDILSATIIAPDCMTADAYATAFMVMGKDRALRIMAQDSTLAGYLIVPSSSDSTQLEVVYSEGFEKYLK